MKFNSAAVLMLILIFSTIAQAQDDYAQPPMPPQSGNTNTSQQPPQPQFSQQELDQMLAPIALYPDALLSQVLMAATYPLEVVQAARWSQANPDLKGDQAVKAAQQNNWDPSVISLTAFPQILSLMNEKLDWTERLGDAFLEQQPQVMDTVQGLRQKAVAAGNLQSNDQVQVQPQGQTIVIQQASPQVVYVPYYDPAVVYGPWWWDDYPPVYWRPWPGYYHRPSFSSGLYVGVGISVGGGFFFGNFDWHQRHVNVVNVNNYYYRNYYNNHPRPPMAGNSRPYPDRGVWQHDPDHRRGVPYPNAALQQQFARPNDARLGRNNGLNGQADRSGNRQNFGNNPANNPAGNANTNANSNAKLSPATASQPLAGGSDRSPDHRNNPGTNRPDSKPATADQPGNAAQDRSFNHRQNTNSPDASPQGSNPRHQNDGNQSPNSQPQPRPQMQQPSIQQAKPAQIKPEQIKPEQIRPAEVRPAEIRQPQQPRMQQPRIEQPRNEAPRPQEQRHEGGGHREGGDKAH